MITVGIDLSLTSTGVAIIDNTGPLLDVRTHRIRTAGKEDAPLADRWKRLDRIRFDIAVAIRPGPINIVVIEGPSLGQTRQRGTHDRSGLWWNVVQALYLNELVVDVAEVPPAARARYATGRGNAAKDAVLAAVIKRYPMVDIDGNDIADALVLAAMGARWAEQPIEDSLPMANLNAMRSVRWPA